MVSNREPVIKVGSLLFTHDGVSALPEVVHRNRLSSLALSPEHGLKRLKFSHQITPVIFMLENQTDWKKYEEYTRAILNDERVKKYLEEHFNLPDIKIQSKEKFSGKCGTEWEVDAYAYDDNDLILIECKHYKSETRVDQNIVAAFAYIIKDVSAKYGIIVTTVGLQSGAKKVANAENIRLIEVHQNSTDENFFVRFPEHYQSVAAFTDKMAGPGGFTFGSCQTTTYPLQEAQKRLIQSSRNQGINRTDFSDEEILEEAKKMMAEQ